MINKSSIIKRREKIRAIFICLLLQACITACITDDDPENVGVGVGDTLPHFSVTLDNGQTVSNSSLQGKIAVIEFFNTGCKDCQQGLPAINRLYEEFKENPEVVIFEIGRASCRERV